MRKSTCFFVNSSPKKAVYLFGGVLSMLAFALISNPVSAVSSYNLTNPSFHSWGGLIGCNTVVSDESITAVGPRGSILGVDSGAKGCGYYMKDGELKWYNDNSNSNFSIAFDSSHQSVNYSLPNSYVEDSPRREDNYNGYGFRSVLQTNNSSFDNDGYFNVPALSSSKFGNYFYFSIFRLNGASSSMLVPSLILSDGNAPILSDSSTIPNLDEFENDVYSTTILTFDSPKNYVPDYIYNELVSSYHIQNDDWSEYGFIGCFLPQYDFSYKIRELNFGSDTPLVQDPLQGKLSFHVYEVGIGNSENLPKLNYMFISNIGSFKGISDIDSWNLTGFVSESYSGIYSCLNTECSSDFSSYVQKYKNLHNDLVSGMINNLHNSNYVSWFNVFSFGFLFPFTNFFNALTGSQSCVNVPIIGGMLSNPNAQYCSWWSNDIRSVLTPVFSIFSIMIIFGFLMSFLKGHSDPITAPSSSGKGVWNYKDSDGWHYGGEV